MEAVADPIKERPGLRERQRQARGAAILDAAFALIVDQGYDALTMEALADRVGISRQTLYHHFASREEITLRAVLTLMDQGIAAIQSSDPSLPAAERLKHTMRRMLESRSEPIYAALVKVRHTLMSVKTHPDYQRAFERRAAALAEIAEAAQAAGEIRADLSSRLIVQMLLGLVSNASHDDGMVPDQRTVTEATEAIISVFFTGLRP